MNARRARRLNALRRAKAAAEACRRAARDLAAIAQLEGAEDEDVFGVMNVREPGDLDELRDFVGLALGERPEGVEVYVISGPSTGRNIHRPTGHRRKHVGAERNGTTGVRRGRARQGA